MEFSTSLCARVDRFDRRLSMAIDTAGRKEAAAWWPVVHRFAIIPDPKQPL